MVTVTSSEIVRGFLVSFILHCTLKFSLVDR